MLALACVPPFSANSVRCLEVLVGAVSFRSTRIPQFPSAPSWTGALSLSLLGGGQFALLFLLYWCALRFRYAISRRGINSINPPPPRMEGASSLLMGPQPHLHPAALGFATRMQGASSLLMGPQPRLHSAALGFATCAPPLLWGQLNRACIRPHWALLFAYKGPHRF